MPAAVATPAPSRPPISLRDLFAEHSVLILASLGAFLLVVATVLFELYGTTGLGGGVRLAAVVALDLIFARRRVPRPRATGYALGRPDLYRAGSRVLLAGGGAALALVSLRALLTVAQAGYLFAAFAAVALVLLVVATALALGRDRYRAGAQGMREGARALGLEQRGEGSQLG